MENDLPPSAFTFRQYLKWSLPALVIGALLRLGTLTAIPEAYFGSDSPSYFRATVGTWYHPHHLDIKEKRRWLYPLICLPLPAFPWSPAISLSVLQHVLGVGIVAGAGWVVADSTRYRAVWVPFVTLLVATDLEVMRDEHELIGDSVFLAAIVATAAIAMPPERLRERRRLFWFLLMAAVVAAIKPHGRGFWLGSIIAAMLITRQPWRWKPEAWAAVAVGIVMILTTGDKRQGHWLMLNSSLPLVDLEGSKWANYRQALKPTVLRARSDFERGEYAWTQKNYKKLLWDGKPTLIDPVWADLADRKNDSDFSQVCGDLAKEAIRAHPVEFAKLTLTKIGVAFSGSEDTGRFDPAVFWEHQAQDNEKRWPDYPEELGLYYRTDQSTYERLVEERRTRRNLALPAITFLHQVRDTQPLVWMRSHYDPATRTHWLTPGCLAVCAAIGLGFCLRPSRFAGTSVIWLPAMILMVTVFAVGDSKIQYTEPIRWAWLVVMAIGLEGISAWALSKLRSAPRDGVPRGAPSPRST